MRTKFEITLAEEINKLYNMLCEKNRKYGNSALDPKRIFSKSSTIEQLNVRIDDKISRIASRQTDDTEDAELDLIGYLLIKRVAIAMDKGLEDGFIKEIEELKKIDPDTKVTIPYGFYLKKEK